MNKEKLIAAMRERMNNNIRLCIEPWQSELAAIMCAEAALTLMSGEWVDVKDSYPDTYGEYIVMINGFIGVAYYEECGLISRFHREDYDNFQHEHVTHWMSLSSIPTPPKQ